MIDAADRWGELAGRVLAELGAEVIKVEPPGGCEARRLGPFDGEESLYWAAVALGKRSVVADDPIQFLAQADVFIEAGFTPGLTDRFPHLVHVSVTPFGVSGPFARVPATEMTVEAAGGLVGLQGDGDRPPVPMGAIPQAAFHAGVQAAADTVVALNERQRSGRGQHLDVSAQACVVWTLMHATGFPPNVGTNPPGTSEYRDGAPPVMAPGLALPFIEPCADGYTQVRFVPSVIGERTFDLMMRWVERERPDDVPEHLKGRDFSNWMTEIRSGTFSVEDAQAAADLVTALIHGKSKAELQRYSAEHGLTVAPIYDVADLFADPHLAAREFWVSVEGRRHPGPFAKLSRTPLLAEAGAPELGELAAPPSRAMPVFEVRDNDKPFAGIRVADFSWVGVGPMIGKALADHGAEVVRIESPGRPDLLRTLPPFKDHIPGPNRTQFLANFNSSKLGVTLDLKSPDGQALARRLADWADVVLESFSPGTINRFGLDYATLAADRPDLIMLSTCMRGQTGPERTYSGFGGQGAAIAGLFGLVGWPDRPPTGPWGAYTDFITPRFGVAALAAAMHHRRHTGEGQYIDLSQIEAGIRFLEPLLLEHDATGRVAERMGIDSPSLCPHGVYATEGHERYVAMAVETEAQYGGLAELVGLPWAFAEREHHKVELNVIIAEWLAQQEPFAAAERLRRYGVPASVVLRPSDLYHDPQLAHREFFVTLEHSEMGPTPYDGPTTIYSRTPHRLRSAAPLLGEHNEVVMREMLGLSEAEICDFRARGAFGPDG